MGSTWVSLRRCLSCGHVGCCDSSPNRHATAHHHETNHPIVRTLQPGQDWAWCYFDEVSLRHEGERWTEIDLFFEAGVYFMDQHVASGGTADVDPDATFGGAFPLGAWVAEMRARKAAGGLSTEQAAELERFPGWHW